MRRTLLAVVIGLALILPAHSTTASEGLGRCIRRAAHIDAGERTKAARQVHRGICHVRYRYL